MSKRHQVFYKTLQLDVLIKIIELSTSFAEAAHRVGISATGRSYTHFKNYVKQMDIATTHFKKRAPTKTSNENCFKENSMVARQKIKAKIIKQNLIKNECAICKITNIWNGKPLKLTLDHINGINNDHRLENLRFLCPNCDSQSDTFCAKNIKNKKNHNHTINLEPLNIESQRILIAETVISALKSNISIRDACKEIKTSPTNIKYFCTNNNINISYYISKECFSKDICKAYLEQSPIIDIAQKYNTSIINIRNILKKNSIKIIDNKYNSFGKSQPITSIPIEQKQSENFIPQEMREELIENLKKHRNLSAVARIYGVTGNSVKKWCQKYEIAYKKYFALDWLSESICKDFSQGLSIIKIAEKLNTSQWNIRRILENNNIEVKTSEFLLTEKETNEIHRRIREGIMMSKISRDLNIPYSAIKRIKRNLN